jgi:outer membrane receptor protein involved in Fe transport
MIAGNLSINLDELGMGTIIKYSSFFYNMPDNTITSVMPSYALVNGYADYTFKSLDICFTGRFDCFNILDKKYSVVKNYPMPGRSFRLSLSFKM